MQKNQIKYKKFVLPETYWIGKTIINQSEMDRYLEDTDQLEFLSEIKEAREIGVSDGEILCSFYAKACYAALTNKKNKNISKVRSIWGNLAGILESGHGSVLEHCLLNFMTRDCSRVYTHELVRHRAGTSFSQTSGRYVRSDELKIIVDPILEPIYDHCEKGRDFLENWYNEAVKLLCLDEVKNFDKKKKLTSALRRLMPNGQANEIGFGVNLRSLRHTLETRTSRHAEWEIRFIFNQVYKLIEKSYPAIVMDASLEMVDGANEIKFRNRKI